VTNANPWWGTARNPRDPSRIPGGSSGGSAIAVVAGMSAAALGSDTGGSIRIPAALCGCVGLKPSYGSIPIEGAFPLGWTLDHAGPLTRTVDDAELLFKVLSAPAPGRRPKLRELRLGVLQGPTFRLVQPAVLDAVETAVGALRRAGMRTRALEIPELEWAEALQLVTLRAEASTVHARWLRSRPRSYGEDVRLRLQLGALIPASDYVLAQRGRARLREALRRAFEQVDVLAMPTTPIVAPAIGERRVLWGSKEEAVDAALVRLTLPFNLSGLPALSVPCPVDSKLPVGLQLVAPWGEERRLFAAGRALEG
jgi:aspartyl-tRNA(Asn)/glutamyl-tRNA(Gln) amidotransferase subunit A